MIYRTTYRDFWVVSHRQYAVGVASDNAWVDTGDREELILWNAEYGVTFVNDHLAGTLIRTYDEAFGSHARALKARAFNDAAVWLRDVQSALYFSRHHDVIRYGYQVEVFRGRKAPRGLYTVEGTVKGRYGPCLTLRSADGTFHRLIPATHVRRVPGPLSAPGVPDSCLPMLDVLARVYCPGSPRNPDAYHAGLAIADALEENPDPRAPHVRAYASYYFNPAPVAAERDPIVGQPWSWRGRFVPLPAAQEGVSP